MISIACGIAIYF